MNKLRVIARVLALALALVLALMAVSALAAAWSDQADYSPGSVVTISGDNSNGAGYLADELVHVDVVGPNGYTAACEDVADANGAWSCQVTLPADESAVGEYTYTATGQTSGVSESGTFTDDSKPVHNVNFATSGLPSGVSITVAWAKTNPAGQTVSGSTTFTSPGPSRDEGTKPATTFTYSGFPSSVTVSDVTYNLASTSPASPFTTGAEGGRTTVTATYVVACTAPSISVDPSSQTKTVGESVTFSVKASGTEPLLYQWRKGGSDISGATGSSYTIPSVVTADAGSYDVVVSNSCGSVTSSAATLMVNKADADVTLSNLVQTYTGSPLTPTATTNPSGLAIVWTNAPQTNAGSYAVTATVDDPNYQGSASGTFVINKANATCSITGYTGVYDGDPHGATGSCTGVKGETLAGLDLGASFTDVPGGTANWTFTDVTGNYNNASGSVAIVINKANATCTVNGYDVIYDGNAHTATGSCVGVKGETLSGLDLGSTEHTTVGTYTDSWKFTDVTGNYNNTVGTVADRIRSWTLAGFYQPVDMSSVAKLVYNTVKNGSTVPLKFEVFAGPTELTTTDSVKSLTYAQTTCDVYASTDEIETVATGGTSLRYDATAGQFVYNWKTPTTPGKCYRVTVTTQDLSTLVAYFKLK